MKKFLISILVVFSFSLILICACVTNGNACSYTIIYSATDGGYIDGETTQKVESGNNGLTVVAVPNDGYEFVQWSDGRTEAARQDKNVTADISVTAEFKLKINPSKRYTVIYQANEGGTISGAVEQSVKEGENGTEVVAVPNEGYKFVKWSDNITEATRQDRNVTKDIVVTAIFEKQTFTLTYVAGNGGYLLGNANQTVAYGESGAMVTVVPKDGYIFVKWSDGSNVPERQDKNITADKTVTAIFEKIKYSVTYKAGVGGTIDGKTEQEIEYGNGIEFVVAVPDEGYRFVKWSDGYSFNIRKDAYVTSEINVTAEFEFLYEGGEGTLSKPFTIANYTQLNDIWYYPESNYKLINDLDLSGIVHEPIFDKINFFKGNFDGGGHTINNLTVETELNYPSLFGVIGGGSVSNLNINNAVIITTDYDTLGWQDKYYVGILAGMVKGYVHDINVSGEIKVDGLSYAGVAVGGITGYANGTVANCLCNVQMDVKHAYYRLSENSFVFGGMIGVGESAYIRDCNAEGQINITECYWTESGSTGDINEYSDILVGGMIGYYFTDRQINAYIRDCRANVEIYGDNHYKAGGFVGYLGAKKDTTLQVVNCSVYGDITCGRVGGFVHKAHNSSNSTLLFDKCIIENNITAYSYGAGFVYFCQGSSDGGLQIKNCYTIGDIKTRGWFDAERVVGYAAGFGWQMSYVSILKSYSKRDMNTCDGRGFSFFFLNSQISLCFYEGTIDISNGAGTLRGVGMFDVFSSSKLGNCYVNVNFVTGEKDTSNLYALIRHGGGKINNFYCYGNYCKIFESYNMQNVSNGHVFKGNIDESNLPQEGDETNITIYESVEDMYFLADKLNEGQDEEIWVNVENGLPQLKSLVVAE